MADPFDLAGRTAVVTGASSGIGRAMALALAAAGATVVGTGRDAARLRAVAEAGVRHTVAADLADGVAALIEGVAARVDRVDILVNAAGTNPRPPLDQQDEAAYRAALAVNLDAPFLLGQHYAPAMAERGWGRIVNVGSQQQHRAFGNSGTYGVAKSGLAGLTRSQSERWAPSGVCVNTVAPGLVATPMTARLLEDPERRAYFERRSHRRRLGTPDDFGAIAVFLAADGADFVTGQTICVDGGFSVT